MFTAFHVRWNHILKFQIGQLRSKTETDYIFRRNYFVPTELYILFVKVREGGRNSDFGIASGRMCLDRIFRSVSASNMWTFSSSNSEHEINSQIRAKLFRAGGNARSLYSRRIEQIGRDIARIVNDDKGTWFYYRYL